MHSMNPPGKHQENGRGESRGEEKFNPGGVAVAEDFMVRFHGAAE
jgi:hypothetical protein